MKILFLNGSPRKNGYTACILKAVEEGISKEHTIEWVYVYDLEVKPCLSCMQCRPDRECVLSEDDGQRIWQKIREADALVIGSPTYWGNMSGPLKTLIDRNVTAFENCAANGKEMPKPLHIGKKAIMVTASNAPWPISRLSTQSKGTLRALETVLKAGGYDIVGSVSFPGAAAKGEIPRSVSQKATKLGKKLVGSASNYG